MDLNEGDIAAKGVRVAATDDSVILATTSWFDGSGEFVGAAFDYDVLECPVP